MNMQFLLDVARRADRAGHGGKSAIYQHAAEEMGISCQTLMRHLSELRPTRRKLRDDAGHSALTLDDARAISAYLMESRRDNHKRLASIEDAVEVLRSNGVIEAGRTDESTGEFMPLSLSAISRALYQYKLHPEQLKRPTPKMPLASLHPNHVWQIDPSLCVLYYLPTKAGECIQVMDEDKFYKNKPANIRRVEKERVWRYVITDHTSGVIFIHYVLGAESGVNLLTAFIHAAIKRPNDPFHGIPKMVMVDPGSANTGAVFRNLCRALGIVLQVNVPKRPWAKGQVEKSNDIVERSFEHRMKFLTNPPTSLEEINDAGQRWMRWFNSQKIHSRTGKSRYAVWQTITAEQLVIAPDAQTMRAVAMNKEETRKVNVQLEISFGGRTYVVADIPGIHVGQRVSVTRNPWHEDVIGVYYRDDNGQELMQMVQAQKVDEYGFPVGTAIIGETFKSHADTELDTNRKAVEKLAMGVDSEADLADARKQHKTPFGGTVDPMKPIDETKLPDYLPKRGSEMEVKAPRIEALRLTPVEAAKRLRERMPNEWTPNHYSWLAQHYPEGVVEDDLDSIIAAMRRLKPTALRAVGDK